MVDMIQTQSGNTAQLDAAALLTVQFSQGLQSQITTKQALLTNGGNPHDGHGSVICDVLSQSMTNLETTAVNQFVASTSQTLWHKTQVLCIGT
jgi:hypothetical protein